MTLPISATFLVQENLDGSRLCRNQENQNSEFKIVAMYNLKT